MAKIELVYRMIGFRIALEREKINMTQEILAKKIGLDRTSIVNIENGRQRIMLHTVEEISKALGIKPLKILKRIWEE